MTIDLVNLHAQSEAITTAEKRIATLERIVLDLMAEIEGLRSAVIDLSKQAGAVIESDNILDESPAGVPGPHTVYGRAYLKMTLLSHCAAGPSSGLDNLLNLYYGCKDNVSPINQAHWREILMLKRLGYGDNQIAIFIKAASEAETHT